MIDHVSLGVRDLQASARFYEAILAPLGYARLVDRPATVGFGTKYPELWLNARPKLSAIAAGPGSHICLRAKSTDAIDAVHRLAIRHGGTCDGPPGSRPGAMVVYYGAFIRDLDGNKIEVMTVPPRPGE